MISREAEQEKRDDNPKTVETEQNGTRELLPPEQSEKDETRRAGRDEGEEISTINLFIIQLVISLCLVGIATSIHSWYMRQDCDTSVNYRQYWSSGAIYDDVRGNELGKEYKQPSCEVQQLYMVVRHGLRYPNRREMIAMKKKLSQLKEHILNNKENGGLCPQTLSALKSWRPMKIPRNVISPSGEADMFNLGLRVYNAYKELFDFASLSQEPNRTFLEVQHTPITNVAQSAQSLVKGLFFRAHDDKAMAAAKNSTIATKKYRDRLIYPSQACKKYLFNRLFNMYSPQHFERKKLAKSDTFKKMLRNLEKSLSLQTKSLDRGATSLMYDACVYGYELYGSDAWCRILEVEGLEMFEYMEDLKYYHRYGYSNPLAYKPLCSMVEDFIKTVRDFMSGASTKRLHLRVGHSGTILSLLTRLGLFQGDPYLKGDGIMEQSNRKWRLSRINPFSSNIIYVIFKSQKNHYMRMYLNEKEVELPGCDTPCPLDDMFKVLHKVVENCDFRAFCDYET